MTGPETSAVILRSSTHTAPEWRGTGGGRRSEQIEEILHRGGFAWTDAVPPARYPRFTLLRACRQLATGRPRIKFALNRRLMGRAAAEYLRYRDHLAGIKGPRLLLVEECNEYARIRAARDSGTPILAVPHNLQVLQQTAPNDVFSGEGLPYSLHRELQFTASCDAIFCISREEQWLLTNFGARADFLPYFPPAAERRRLQAIREARRPPSATTPEILVIATGSNAKNRDGLVELAALIASLQPQPDVHWHVAGRDTEDLQTHFARGRCTFHGQVSARLLNDLMLRCRAAVAYQCSGAGALTRIPEFLCAGIPVLANPHAARSAHRLPGLHVFHDAAELARLAGAPLPLPPAIPPDTAAEDRLIATVRRLLERTRSGSASR